jgi:hypothetical protein
MTEHRDWNEAPTYTLHDGRIRRLPPDPFEIPPQRSDAALIAELRRSVLDAEAVSLSQATLLASYARVIRRRRAIGAAMVLAAFAGGFGAVFLIRWAGW